MEGERGFEGLGAFEPSVREGGAVWCTKPKTAHCGLDIGAACVEPLENGGWVLIEVGERVFAGLGALEPGIREGGPFGARNRKPPVTGSISVRRAWNHLKTVAVGLLKRGRGGLRAWVPSNPVYERRGGGSC